VTLALAELNGDLCWVEYTDDSVNWYNAELYASCWLAGWATVYDWEPPRWTRRRDVSGAALDSVEHSLPLNYSHEQLCEPRTWPIPRVTLRAPLLMTSRQGTPRGTLDDGYGENSPSTNRWATRRQ